MFARFIPRVRPFALVLACSAVAAGPDPFVIHVVDRETGRGVPLVELRTTNGIRIHTDNAGVVAFDEPGLLGREVFFHVSSDGYELEADGFGFRGRKLKTSAGGEATIKIRRTQIAQRLYRITGQGLYHHAWRAGLKVPLKRSALNGKVMGQDTVMAMVHRGAIRWFWGDTNRPGYPLGHFGTATATSRLPGSGGLDPSVGIELEYALDKQGFSRPAFSLGRPGMVWVHGTFVLEDSDGKPKILTHYARMKSLDERLEHGLAIFDDDAARFEPIVRLDDEAELHPFGQAFIAGDHVYFATPYPLTRVRARWADATDPRAYDTFTCLKSGARYDKDGPAIVRDGAGKAVYAWRKRAAPVGASRQKEMVRAGHLGAREGWIRTVDAGSGKPIDLHRGSVRWNGFRRRFVMIANRAGGEDSYLGEVYYAESDAPHGPWPRAVKVAMHRGYSFYNPVHHAFFDADGGKTIYFEGTYTRTFSRTKAPTPRYDYNQIMFRLDLSHPRLAATR